MQKQLKIFLLFCLCLMFLPNLVNAETYDAYFVESSEYTDVINRFDNQTTVGQVKRYAFNADINWVEYEPVWNYLTQRHEYSLNSVMERSPISSVNNLTVIYDNITYNNNEINLKVLEFATTGSSNLIFKPNVRTWTEKDFSVQIMFKTDNFVTSVNYFLQITNGSKYLYFGLSYCNSTHFKFQITNSTATYDKGFIPLHTSSIYNMILNYSQSTDKLYAKVRNLDYNFTYSSFVYDFSGLTTNVYCIFRNYRHTTALCRTKIIAIDSDKIVVENPTDVGTYSSTTDESYTEDRILEMYNVKDESYGLADYGVINEYIPEFQSYYNQSNYFAVEPWNNDYLNPISTYTLDYRFDAYKKRYRQIGGWECKQNDATELSKIVFKNESVLTDSDRFSQLVVFSIENVECYPIIFNFLVNEDEWGFTLEYYDDILYLFRTSYEDSEYTGHILVEELNVASYCSYLHEFLFFISGYQLGSNYFFSYTLMINQIEFWFDYDVIEDCVNTFTGINDSVMILTDLDDNALRVAFPFNTSLLNRPYDFILKCFYVSDEYKLSITDFNEIWKSIDYRCFSESYEIESEFEAFDFFLNHNITDFLLYYLVVNITVRSEESITDLVVHSIFPIDEFFNESNYVVNYTIDEEFQDLELFFIYIMLFCENINFTADITISIMEFWLIDWEIVEVGWFSVLMKGIAPLSIIVVFAVAGYYFFKIKGVISAIALSFIVLYFMNMINLVSAIMLVVVMIMMLVYHIKRKGANIDV